VATLINFFYIVEWVIGILAVALFIMGVIKFV